MTSLNNGGGATPLSQRSRWTRLTGSLKNVSWHEIIKGLGGTGLVKLLRYYGTKALRGNRNVGGHYYADRKHTVGLVNPTYKKLKRSFAGAQNDMNASRHCKTYNEIDKEANTNYNSNIMNYKSENKTVSEAHSKHLVPYCLSNLVFSKKVAFTLAEILITLGIIGIVAAMTIPTLISKYQEKVLENQFKKSYAILNQALLSAQSQFGYLPKCYYPWEGGNLTEMSDCQQLTANFLASLKITKTCKDHAYEKGCIPEYRGVDDILKEQHKDDEDYDEDYWQDYATINCGGFNTDKILNNKTVYNLADGTILFFFYGSRDRGAVITAMDINGMKGPNKWGYDLYALTIRSDGNRFSFGFTGCSPVEEGGKSFDQMYKEAFQ